MRTDSGDAQRLHDVLAKLAPELPQLGDWQIVQQPCALQLSVSRQCWSMSRTEQSP